jgi:uncharacterized membrane protein YqhA
MAGFVRQLLASSRYFIVVVVVGCFVASAAALLDGGLATVLIVIRTFTSLDFSTTGAKLLSVDLITMIDLLLIGTVLYIFAVGLHELFIDPGLPMPRWLRITTLDDLKERLFGVVAVLLAVTFLGSENALHDDDPVFFSRQRTADGRRKAIDRVRAWQLVKSASERADVRVLALRATGYGGVGDPAPVHPHLFRHARVRQIVRHTKSLALAQKQAGWARLHTEYLTLSDDEARRLMRDVPE